MSDRLTEKQRELCRLAQQEERKRIVAYLRKLAALRLVEDDPAEMLNIAAGDIDHGKHRLL